ncbi:MAG: alpha/beta hydrolase [Myxococcaceae bacterium]|nr:alpha/beta hydrolase [Myxococcaceae bacterium]
MHWVEAGAGPTVVLLHGFPEMWWSWRHQIQALAEAGFRVVVPDQRGYNDTGKQGPYDLETLSGDICNLIDALGAGPKARIVGHDWGGAVAWYLGVRRPEHVERLAVLNCPHPLAMRAGLLKPRQALRSWYMFFFQVPALAEWLLTKDGAGNLLRMLKGNAIDRTNYSDEELQPFADAIQKPGAAKAMVGWYRAMPKQLLNPPPVTTIEVDTLLLWGMRDSALGFDELVPGTERWVKNLKVQRIENAGHFVQSDQPAKVNEALIDFLSA